MSSDASDSLNICEKKYTDLLESRPNIYTATSLGLLNSGLGVLYSYKSIEYSHQNTNMLAISYAAFDVFFLISALGLISKDETYIKTSIAGLALFKLTVPLGFLIDIKPSLI